MCKKNYNKIYFKYRHSNIFNIIFIYRGPDSMLVVWDAKTGTPKKTIFDPHPFGT